MIELGEESRRLPGFTEGESAILGDGQAWTFPLIRINFASTEEGALVGLPWRVGDELTHDDLYRGLLSAEAKDADDEDFKQSVATIGTMFLRMNYSLSNNEVDTLLQRGWGGEDRVPSHIIEVIQGAILDRPREQAIHDLALAREAIRVALGEAGGEQAD